MLDSYLGISRSMRVIVMSALCGLLLLAAYLYVFKAPLKEHRDLSQTHRMLAGNAQQVDQLPQQIQTLQQQINMLTGQLHGKAPPLPTNQLIAHMIGELGKLAAQHKLDLLSVQPGETYEVRMFKGLPFDLKIEGEYAALYAWLIDVERQLGPLIVEHFALEPKDSEERILMSLKLSSYRVQG